ncbi:FAD-binding oxidoreductase [Methylovulum psychrotolerans]|uniref:Oxygenase n=1 Tax=Methylovulum psychrotolerans TaxID=1704499 RepID=A0A2S5CIE8_9GAMM|nr:FAD-binding oxidoreductase [Methylovulum psychrotolerans]POZ50581.1 oxygenase [Methylovulum psychrotolerans]
MYKITIEDKVYACQPEETVLDTLLRENVAIPYACKKGTCHSCMVRSIDIAPPAIAQAGLKDTLKKRKHFLACQCYPEQDMTIRLPDQSEFYTDGTVVVNEMLNRNTLLLVIAFKDALEFNAGQFVNLQRPDGLTRSYSIANIPQASNTLEFHIRRLPNGKFSNWLHDEIKAGDSIAVSEPRGHCFYLPERHEQGLLLVGTGTGLAPLAGILTDALSHGHSGPIYLFHGSREVEDLYRIEELRQLARQHPNFHYIPCLSGELVPDGFTQGRTHEVALAAFADLKGWRVFFCGHPDMVNQMKRMAFLKGAASKDIYADAFVISPN